MQAFSRKVRITAWVAAAAVAVMVAAGAAWAMSVSPVLIDLKPGGRQASGQIRVVNTGQTPMPIELTTRAAAVGPDGTVTTSEDGIDDLMLFPPQALVAPGATQVFRVQWAGDADLAESKTFLVSVAQQPVELPEGTSGIQLLYDFQVVVNVAPLLGAPDLKVQSAELTTDDKGVRRAAVTLTNASNVHGYLSGAHLRLELQDAGGRRVWSQSYTPDELRGRVGIGLIQPRTSRRFLLPLDLPPEGAQVVAEVRYEGRR